MDTKSCEGAQVLDANQKKETQDNSPEAPAQEAEAPANDEDEKPDPLPKEEQEEPAPAGECQNVGEQQEESVHKREEEHSQARPPLVQLEHKHRVVVKHSILGNKIPSHDPNVLVESTTFTSVGKIQPFLLTISTNAALVLDYHCHLTTSEVCGYLAGNWDVNSHTLFVSDAFPCKCRLGDQESAPLVEAEIRKAIKSNGLTLVGWYHSHPTAPATPSLRDIETQLDYQLRMKGSNDSTYLPCIGVICSPYNLDNPTFESTVVSYWVIPPPENKIHEYGRPMIMSYSVFQDQAISHDVLLEMKKCADFYKPEKDYIHFSEVFTKSLTFLDKLKLSLASKFPLNHHKGDALWTYIHDITLPLAHKTDTDVLKQLVDISTAPTATPPPLDSPKFNIPPIPPPYNSAPPYHKSHSRSKSSSTPSGKRSRDKPSLNNYFVGSELAALFGAGKFPGMEPSAKSLLNLNSLSLGGMFLPPMAAAYKPDAGLMKPPPPPNSYYSYPSSRNASNSRGGSSSRSQSRNIPSTSRETSPGASKVPKVEAHQMGSFFIPGSLGKNCTVTSRSSSSGSGK